MKYIFLFFTDLYFRVFPVHKKTKCIFRKDCRTSILENFKEKGSMNGLKAAWFRYRNCRPGFSILKNPRTGETNMVLRTDKIVAEDEIANHLLKTPDRKIQD